MKKIKLTHENTAPSLHDKINAGLNELEIQDSYKVPMKPFQKIINDHKFALCQSSKGFEKTMRSILAEIEEIYGDKNLTDLFGSVILDCVDHDFIVNGNSVLHSVSKNQYNKKMTRIVKKLTNDTFQIEACSPSAEWLEKIEKKQQYEIGMVKSPNGVEFVATKGSLSGFYHVSLINIEDARFIPEDDERWRKYDDLRFIIYATRARL